MTRKSVGPAPARVFKIANKLGLHAQCVEKFDADVRVTKDGHVVGGTSIMGLMMLAASRGSSIHVSATGKDAKKAIAALADLIDQKFGEDD